MSPKRRPNRPIDVYVRVSAVRGRGDDLLSTEIQEERCRAQLVALGLEAGQVFTDLDVSGTKESRPAFDKLKERIASGESGGIVVYKLSRFGRNVKQVLRDVKWIEAQGALFVCVDPTIDTSTPTGTFVLTVFAALDEMEAGNIGVAWRLAKESAVARGIHISRHVPPGYVRDPQTRKLVPHPVHSKTIATAFQLASAGDSYAHIASVLNKTKLPVGGKDGVWQPNRIKRLLANRVYLGEARSGNGIANPTAHKALVDPVTFQLAQRDRKGPAVTASAGSLLAGICRCASCSFSMRSQSPRGNTVGVYRCATTGSHGRCPAPSTVSRERLERYVLDQFLARVQSQELHATETDEASAELLDAVTQSEQSYRSALTDTDLRRQIGDADHNLLVAKLKNEWQDAIYAVAATRTSAPVIDSAKIADLVAELQSRGDVAGLRDLLASAIDAVFVRPAASRARNLPIEDRVRIVWRDEDAKLVRPRRGERFEPRAFVW